MVRRLIFFLVLASVSAGCGQSNRASHYFRQGNVYVEQGDLDQAIAEYDQAIRLKPDFALAYYNRASATAPRVIMIGPSPISITPSKASLTRPVCISSVRWC